jgi:type II secretory pathway pseudopilin PulG
MRGIALIEIIVGVAVVAASFLMLGNIAQLTVRLVDVGTERLQATFLLSEGIEAVRTMRDRGWTENIMPLSATTIYYLQFDAVKNEWATTTSAQILDGVFTRSFVLGEVERNAEDDIVSSGGTADSGTRRIDMKVEWDNRGRAYEESISTYITDLFNN